MGNLRWIIIGALGIFIMYSLFFNSDSDSTADMTAEEIVTPTEGVITTVKEIKKDEFKIEDEEIVATPEESKIIAKYIDGTVDTFSLEEAKVAANDQTHRRNPMFSMVSYGLMGYMMGRSMGSFRPRSSSYMDQNTYNRVNNGAGQRMQTSAKRTSVSRPKSGFGGKSSPRSHGG